MSPQPRAFAGMERALVGVVHVGALPATPASQEPVRSLASRACDEARLLHDVGFDAIILENMHDRPYVHGAQSPEIVSAMTAIGCAVRRVTDKPLGIQVLSGGNREALAIALAVDAQFVRVENFVYAHVADEGLLERAEAGPLLRYRRAISAEHVLVLCDVQKKHAAHALTSDLELTDLTEGAEFFGAEGLVVSGRATGKPTSMEDVDVVRGACSLPVLVGSGASADSVGELLEHADGVIVGSAIKRDGHWHEPVERERAEAFVRAVRG